MAMDCLCMLEFSLSHMALKVCRQEWTWLWKLSGWFGGGKKQFGPQGELSTNGMMTATGTLLEMIKLAPHEPKPETCSAN